MPEEINENMILSRADELEQDLNWINHIDVNRLASVYDTYMGGNTKKIPILKKIMKKIGNDDEDEYNNKEDKSKIMVDQVNKLTKEEINKSICENVSKYYKKNYIEKLGKETPLGYFPINSIFDFVMSKLNINNKRQPEITGILLGYIEENKIINQNNEMIKYFNNSLDLEIIFYVLKSNDKKVKPKSIIKVSKNNVIRYSNCSDSFDNIPINIFDSSLSAKVFGLPEIKKSLEGTTIKDYKIEFGVSKKIGESYFVIIPYVNSKEEKKHLRFVLNDINFLIPSTKGYNIPKDKTITVGQKVRVKQSNLKVTTDMILTVQNIKVNPQSKRISKNSKTKKLDIIMCSTNKGNVFRFKANELKQINNINYERNSKEQVSF